MIWEWGFIEGRKGSKMVQPKMRPVQLEARVISTKNEVARLLGDNALAIEVVSGAWLQDIRPKANKLPVGPCVVRNLNFPRCTYDENLPITKNPDPNATGS
ncbi:putative formamidase [Helianthus annuus]|nr:putative formamidase [Helianthus annuus]KAJ0596145.1 putative formamidase [Helianthus annuus]KAJ0632877.1 putative formamidase [Helianthus annuus]KAJ0826853.1 putative formamidase [Helianthus annuus]KAJ0925821.1 putative formamidase [Helianthus annuus]